MQMTKKLKAARGFTLIELMIVVAIIGILAAIAIPNFLRYQMRTKRSEGSVNVAAIRTGQISYFASNGAFLNINGGNHFPTSTPLSTTQTWNMTQQGAKDFHEIGFQPEGKVYFMYRSTGTTSGPPAFVAEAIGDIDGDEDFSCWGFGRPAYDKDGGIAAAPPALTDDCRAAAIGGSDGEEPADESCTPGTDCHYNKVTLVTPERIF